MKVNWTEREVKTLRYRIVRLKLGASDDLPAGTEGVILHFYDGAPVNPIKTRLVSVYVSGHGDDDDEDYGVLHLPIDLLEVTEAYDQDRRNYAKNPEVIRVSSRGELLGHYDEDGEFVPREVEDD